MVPRSSGSVRLSMLRVCGVQGKISTLYENHPMYRLLICLLVSACLRTSAQSTVNTGWQGHEYATKQFSDIDGSPFLFDEFYRGRIVSAEGLVLDGIKENK